MKTASESGWPEARNFWRASSRESARTEKITRRSVRPMKWKRSSCWTSWSGEDNVAFLGRGEIEERSLHFGRDDRPWESAQGGSDRSTELSGGSTEK